MRSLFKITFLSLFGSWAYSQETVGILDFEAIGISLNESKALSNRFGSEFQTLSTGRYVLVERQQMGAILEEQGLQQSGCVSSECAVEVGNALGAKFIVTGSISKVGNIFSVTVKLIDVETSQIIKSISHDQMGNIGVLLTQGMKTAASKILDISTQNEPVTTTQRFGSIRLLSLEKGVTLHNPDNGKFISVAPTRAEEIKNLTPGSYRFLAKKNGFEDKLFEVEVTAGTISDLTITGLKKPMGTLTITSNEDQAEVYFYNQLDQFELLGMVPFTTQPQEQGISYKYRISKPGYDVVVKNVILNSKSQQLNVDLVRTLPSVKIDVDPYSATVLVNGKESLISSLIQLEPGPHKIEIKKEGYITQADDLYLAYGDNKEVKYSLVRAIADIQLSLNTEKFKVTKNGKKTSEALLNNTLKEVPFGLHSYLVTAPKYESFRLDINIENTETVFENITLTKKSKAKALRQSILLPGWGQMYAEDRTKGILMMGLHFGAGALLYSNYSKYVKSSDLKDLNYERYMKATSTANITRNHAAYKSNIVDANNAAAVVMAMGATFAINWAFSVIDVFLFSDLE